MMKKFFAAIILIMLASPVMYAAEDLKSLKSKAELGDPDAMNKIGVIYHNGQGVKRNYAEAMSWYKKASEQNENPRARELAQKALKGK